MDKENLQAQAKDASLLKTVESSFSLITDLLKRVLELLKRFRVTRLQLHVICADADPAEAAMLYGRYCAVVYGFANLLRSQIKIPEKGEDIAVLFDLNASKNRYRFHLELSMGIHRILGAFLRILWDEAKRNIKK